MQEAVTAMVLLSRSVTEPVSTWVREEGHKWSVVWVGWGLCSHLSCLGPSGFVADRGLCPCLSGVPVPDLMCCVGTAFATVFFRLGFGDMVAER